MIVRDYGSLVCLLVPIQGRLEQQDLGTLELVASFDSSLVNVWQIFEISIQPNFLHTSGEMGKQLGNCGLVEEFAGNTSDEDSIGLGGRGMNGVHQVTLAKSDKVAHLIFDVVEDPEGEEPDQDDVRGITLLLRFGNISVGELIESFLVVGGANSVDGHENSPGNKPDRKENTGHHAEEPHEKEGVHSIVVTNVIVICLPNIQGPTQQTSAQRLLSLIFCGEICSGLIDCLETFANKGEYEDFGAEHSSVENEGCDKGRRRRPRRFVANVRHVVELRAICSLQSGLDEVAVQVVFYKNSVFGG